MNKIRWYGLLMMATIYVVIFICKEKNAKRNSTKLDGVGQNLELVQFATSNQFNQQNDRSFEELDDKANLSFESFELLLMVDQNHWKTIMKVSEPHSEGYLDQGIWFYARGVALLNLDDTDGATSCLEELKDLYVKLSVDQLVKDDIKTSTIQQILLDLQGEITSKLTANSFLAISS